MLYPTYGCVSYEHFQYGACCYMVVWFRHLQTQILCLLSECAQILARRSRLAVEITCGEGRVGAGIIRVMGYYVQSVRMRKVMG